MEELKRVKDIFTEIQNVSSIKAKEYILKQNADNELFKECLKFLLDGNVITGLSTKKMNKDVLLVNETFVDIRDVFKYLQTHNTGTDHDIAIIKSYCYFQGELEDFCKDIFTKKLKLGIDTKVVNRVYPNFIREFNVQLASKFEEKSVIGKEFIITNKIDGIKCICIVENSIPKFYTRQGKLIENLVDIENSVKKLGIVDFVFDGELYYNGYVEDSKDGYSKTMNNVSIKGEKKNLVYMVYDCLRSSEEFYKGKCDLNTYDRKELVKSVLKSSDKFIDYLDPLYCGNDFKVISEYLKRADDTGEEGIIVSLSDSKWLGKRNKGCMKLKTFKDGEVFVTSIYEGEGRLKGKLGGVNAEFIYKGEVCNVSIGSGWSDSDREYLFNNPNEIIGKVISIKLFEISQDSKTKKYSLRFPTVALPFPECIRLDKTTLEETNVE